MCVYGHVCCTCAYVWSLHVLSLWNLPCTLPPTHSYACMLHSSSSRAARPLLGIPQMPLGGKPTQLMWNTPHLCCRNPASWEVVLSSNVTCQEGLCVCQEEGFMKSVLKMKGRTQESQLYMFSAVDSGHSLASALRMPLLYPFIFLQKEMEGSLGAWIKRQA